MFTSIVVKFNLCAWDDNLVHMILMKVTFAYDIHFEFKNRVKLEDEL